MSRRRLLGLGLGALGAAALAGCAAPGPPLVNAEPVIPPAAPGERITLTYWAWLNDLQNVCDIWNAKHPNIQVEAVFGLPGNSGGYEKMYSALDTGGGPDIGRIELRSVPEFMLVSGLVDLARYGAQDYAHLYNPAVWSQVSFNGGVYAIPQDSGPMGFFYQPAALAKVGATPPTTWAQWAEVAQEIRKENKANYLESVSVSDPSWFIALAEQAGATWFQASPEGWVITMDDEPTMNVARFFDKAIDGRPGQYRVRPVQRRLDGSGGARADRGGHQRIVG
jgi:multiple sugar transport system substrate-binding protein